MSRMLRNMLMASYVSSGPTYDAEAAAYFTAAGITDPIIKAAANTLIVNGKAKGWWTPLDAMWLLANEGQPQALVNLKAGQPALTLVSGPTFTQYQGIQGNGSTKYINTNWIPATHGVHYTLTSATTFGYCRNNFAGTGGQIFGGHDGSNNGSALFPSNGGTFYADVNNAVGGNPVATTADTRGLTVAVRAASNDCDGYVRGVKVGDGTGAIAPALGTVAWYAGGHNVNGSFDWGSVAQISILGVGGALTPTQIASLETDVTAYMTALGTNV